MIYRDRKREYDRGNGRGELKEALEEMERGKTEIVNRH